MLDGHEERLTVLEHRMAVLASAVMTGMMRRMADGDSREMHVADSAEVAEMVQVRIIAHMWITWSEVAIEHEQACRKARDELVAAHAAGNGTRQGDALRHETVEGLLTICSAAFAMECLVSVWARIVMPTEALKWEDKERKPPPVASRASEVLKRTMETGVTAEALANRWAAVFDLRNDSVHFTEKALAPEQHPSGIGGVAPVDVSYGYENATNAIGLLIQTLDAVRAARKPSVRTWLDNFGPSMERLREKQRAVVSEC